MKYEKNIDIRWADLDPNFHVLHSKYLDFGAYCRMSFFDISFNDLHHFIILYKYFNTAPTADMF